jgi:hypothetical protein
MSARRPETPGSAPVAVRSVVAQLAPTLGWERSVEAVAATIRRLCLDEDTLTPRDVTAILEDLALEEGLVGVTARFALSKSVSRPQMPAMTIPPPSDSAPASSVLVTTIGLHEVASQLAPMLGADKTETALQASMRRLGLVKARLDREQATRLLDDLGHQDGVVGMTARFARARVLARFGG